MQRRISSALVVLLLGAAALLAVMAPAVAASESSALALDAAGEELEDAILDEADAELDEEEGIDSEVDDESEDETEDEAEDGSALVEVEDVPQTADPVKPGQVESSEVPQTPGVVPVQPQPQPPVTPAAPKKGGKKHHKKRLPIEAAYYGEKFPRKAKAYRLPEYGDPNPKKTAALARKARKSGKPQHKRVFTANYYSPLPAPHPHVKCYGKGKHEKCYRVTKAGVVVGRHRHAGLPRVVAETRSLHAMEKKGFVSAEYDDKLARWKPKKHKRTLSPAAVMSLIEEDAEDDSEDESEAEADAEDEGESEADSESESESESEFVPAHLVRKGCPKAEVCPKCKQPKPVANARRTKKHANTFSRMHSTDDAEADMTVRDSLRPAFLAGVQFADDAVKFQLKRDKLKRKHKIEILDAVRAHTTIPKGCPLLPKKLDCPCPLPIAVAPLPETSRAAMGYSLKLGDADMSYRWSMREAARDAFMAGVKYADTERMARQANSSVEPEDDVKAEADDHTGGNTRTAMDKLKDQLQAMKDRDASRAQRA